MWFTRLTLGNLIIAARDVVTKMSNNPLYPLPDPPLVEVTAAADAAEEAMEEASDGDRQKIAVRDEKEEALVGKMRDLLSFVQGHCGNSVANVLSAGFRVRKTPTPVGMLPAPENVRLSYTGMTGEILFRTKAVKGKLTYAIQMAETPEGPYVTIATASSSRTTLNGFTPMKQYWIRACANGTAGPGPYCPPICMIAV